jgi:hypothetical protein
MDAGKALLFGGGALLITALLWPRKANQGEAQMVGVLNGFGAQVPCGVQIHPDDPFKVSRKRAQIVQICYHESVTHDPDVLEDEPGEADDATERVLDRRGLGVHLMVGVAPDGSAQVVQHNPLEDVLPHTGKPVNDLSVGIEIVNPYYGPTKIWRDAIPAPWAHKGTYTLPHLVQVEAAYQLTLGVWKASEAGIPGYAVPRRFWGVEGDRFALGPVKIDKNTPGVLAHHHYGGHADAAWVALYCAIRERGLDPERAYAAAKGLATNARGGVTLPGGRIG